MLLNIRALAHSNHTTDMEMSAATLHFAPLKYCKTKPDVTMGTMSVYLGDGFRGIPEERHGDDGTQPTDRDTIRGVQFGT
jgi:hypothetical protein